ncbi:MAG: HupE/UreJ family protein [Pseudomonadota bacterium]
MPHLFAGRLTLLLAGTLCLLLAQSSSADPQSKSWSHWRLLPDNRVEGRFTISGGEIARLRNRDGTDDGAQSTPASLAAAWRNHLAAVVDLSSPNAQCHLLDARSLTAARGYQRAQLRWQCDIEPLELFLKLPLLGEVTASHIHFATLIGPDGRRTERLFSYATPAQRLALTGSSPEGPAFSGRRDVLGAYIRFGFEHILIGVDHIAFVLTLMLLSSRLRHLLWIVTGFTVGHSVTLSLATLGLLNPRLYLVEALIGLTIAITAVENVVCRSGQQRGAAWLFALMLLVIAAWDALGTGDLPGLTLVGLALFCYCYFMLGSSEARALRMRGAITILFGLVHGFGFASVLLEVGLPDSSRTTALLGFNIGVELGQLLIVGALAALTWPLRRRWPATARSAADWVSAALCGLGIFWFLQRLYL